MNEFGKNVLKLLGFGWLFCLPLQIFSELRQGHLDVLFVFRAGGFSLLGFAAGLVLLLLQFRAAGKGLKSAVIVSIAISFIAFMGNLSADQ